MFIDVSEERSASTFKVEEETMQVTSNICLLPVSQQLLVCLILSS
jgi:hypothetical protein